MSFGMEIIGWVARSLFVLLFGINFQFYANKNLNYFAKRLCKLFICALIITISTYIFVPNLFVVFGVLHLFTISLLILRFAPNVLQLFLALMSFIALLFPALELESNWFLIFGLPSKSFQSIDYFPLFPYFGIIYLGKCMGPFFIKKIPILKSNMLIEIISRNSLWIYMCHMPVILLFDYMLR